MRDGAVRLLSRAHRVLFRATGGRLGGRLPTVRGPMLLLTTTGRRTGRPHTVPLLHVPDPPGWAVIASYGGRDHHPDWFLNLDAHPEATAQLGRLRIAVRATAVEGARRDRLWARAIDAHPGYAQYATRTDRVIPVVSLQPVRSGG